MVPKDRGLPSKASNKITSQRDSCVISMFWKIPSQNHPLLILWTEPKFCLKGPCWVNPRMIFVLKATTKGQ